MLGWWYLLLLLWVPFSPWSCIFAGIFQELSLYLLNCILQFIFSLCVSSHLCWTSMLLAMKFSINIVLALQDTTWVRKYCHHYLWNFAMEGPTYYSVNFLQLFYIKCPISGALAAYTSLWDMYVYLSKFAENIWLKYFFFLSCWFCVISRKWRIFFWCHIHARRWRFILDFVHCIRFFIALMTPCVVKNETGIINRC